MSGNSKIISCSIIDDYLYANYTLYHPKHFNTLLLSESGFVKFLSTEITDYLALEMQRSQSADNAPIGFDRSSQNRSHQADQMMFKYKDSALTARREGISWPPWPRTLALMLREKKPHRTATVASVPVAQST